MGTGFELNMIRGKKELHIYTNNPFRMHLAYFCEVSFSGFVSLELNTIMTRCLWMKERRRIFGDNSKFTCCTYIMSISL